MKITAREVVGSSDGSAWHRDRALYSGGAKHKLMWSSRCGSSAPYFHLVKEPKRITAYACQDSCVAANQLDDNTRTAFLVARVESRTWGWRRVGVDASSRLILLCT
jgi:hypothetical protein